MKTPYFPVSPKPGQHEPFCKTDHFWLVLVFVLGGTLVIMNAIQLTIYMRRQEINIMRLVGATPYLCVFLLFLRECCMRARHHDKFSFSSSFEQNIRLKTAHCGTITTLLKSAKFSGLNWQSPVSWRYQQFRRSPAVRKRKRTQL